MRHLLIILTIAATAMLAAPCSCGGKSGHGGHGGYAKAAGTLPTLHYALDKMKLLDAPEVQMALQSYRMRVAAVPKGMNTDAFKNGTFDRAAFLKASGKVQKAEAQADLFEAIYGGLTAEQKTEMHRLMAGHQHYMSLRMAEMGGKGKGSCGAKGQGKSCGSKQSGQSCGSKKGAACNCSPKCDCGTKCDCGSACNCGGKAKSSSQCSCAGKQGGGKGTCPKP
jgi:hypothetical protein